MSRAAYKFKTELQQWVEQNPEQIFQCVKSPWSIIEGLNEESVKDLMFSGNKGPQFRASTRNVLAEIATLKKECFRDEKRRSYDFLDALFRFTSIEGPEKRQLIGIEAGTNLPTATTLYLLINFEINGQYYYYGLSAERCYL